MRLPLPFLAVSIATWAVAAPAGEPESLAALAVAMNCTTCHHPDAIDSTVPDLTGQSAPELIEKMNGFRTGSIEGTIMTRIATALTDEQVESVASYIAGTWTKGGANP